MDSYQAFRRQVRDGKRPVLHFILTTTGPTVAALIVAAFGKKLGIVPDDWDQGKINAWCSVVGISAIAVGVYLVERRWQWRKAYDRFQALSEENDSLRGELDDRRRKKEACELLAQFIAKGNGLMTEYLIDPDNPTVGIDIVQFGMDVAEMVGATLGPTYLARLNIHKSYPDHPAKLSRLQIQPYDGLRRNVENLEQFMRECQ